MWQQSPSIARDKLDVEALRERLQKLSDDELAEFEKGATFMSVRTHATLAHHITNRGLASRPCRQMTNTARMFIDFRLGLRLQARN